MKRCSEIFGALWRDDDGFAREILSKVEQDNDGQIGMILGMANACIHESKPRG